MCIYLKTLVLTVSLGGLFATVATGATLDSSRWARGTLSGNTSPLSLTPRSQAQCRPMHTVFSSPGIVSKQDWTPLDSSQSYALDTNGLSLFLDKPSGKVATKGNTNSRVAEGSTFNSTFALKYGKVTYTFSGPDVPGVVTAAILIAPESDEIDIELVGGDPRHWQTNVFAPAPHEDKPLYSTFSSVQKYPHNSDTVKSTHTYTIDWSPERIIWSVDGSEVRTLHKDDTRQHGFLHYPSHATRLQFGIWDASAPSGTSEWARGPIDWANAPARMSAVFESIEVECPY